MSWGVDDAGDIEAGASLVRSQEVRQQVRRWGHPGEGVGPGR